MFSLSQSISVFSMIPNSSQGLSYDFVFPNNTNETYLYSITTNLQRLIGEKIFPVHGNYCADDNPYIKFLGFTDKTIEDRTAYSGYNSYIDFLKIENLYKIDCMSNFKKDWNGSGGMSFSSSAINTFKKILNGLNKQPQIAPTGRNSLFMQYEENSNLLAFEVTESKVEMVRLSNNDYTTAISKTFKNDFINRINSEVALFYGSECY